MCGFAGVVVWDEKFRVSRETLEKMSARVAHRGPDGQGLYLSPDAQITPDRPQVGLAFRRLAILDLNPRANQPFTDNEGRWLVFNGEIYNFRELRAELSKLKPEYEWRTTGDGEVLLIAYDVWGEKCVEHLNGMFAFAIWDAPRRQLFLSIDRMGQKPLYWSAVSAGGAPWSGVSVAPRNPQWRSAGDGAAVIDPPLAAFAFASELPSLRALPWVDGSLSSPSLRSYLALGYVPAPRTIHRGISKLMPATRGTLCSTRAEADQYFDADGPPVRVSDSYAVQTTRSLIECAVKRQLVADVPVGCFLSGGVDSSIIACAMRQAVESGQQVLTFSIGFPDPRYDERDYASAIAKHLGTDHQEFLVTPDAARDLPALAAAFGEPFGDSSALPTHYLARETRRHVKVTLSGDGGDELFGGYDRYRALYMTAAFDRVPDSVRRAAASRVWQRLPGSHPKSALTRFKRLLRTAEFPDALRRYARMMSLFEPSDIDELSAPESPPQGAPMLWLLAIGFRRTVDRGAVESALAIDRATYLPGDLLTKLDRASMLHALEVRSPFMDHELVQFAAGLTTNQLLKGGAKRMLREAFREDLPAWVFKRKKMGFAVPIGEWFRGPLRLMLHDLLFGSDSFARTHFNIDVVRRLVDAHHFQRHDHSQRLYALLMLELWWRASKVA